MKNEKGLTKKDSFYYFFLYTYIYICIYMHMYSMCSYESHSILGFVLSCLYTFSLVSISIYVNFVSFYLMVDTAALNAVMPPHSYVCVSFFFFLCSLYVSLSLQFMCLCKRLERKIQSIHICYSHFHTIFFFFFFII